MAWLLGCFLLFGFASQGDEGTLVGRITDAISGQPIGGAEISVQGQGRTVADAEGRYRLTLAPGTYDVKISAVGYASLVVNEVKINSQRTTVEDARLRPAIEERVEVRSGAFVENDEMAASNIALRREEIRATPGTGGDPLRALSALPGISSVSTEFADLIVRGGTPDENLYLIENIPIDDFTYFTDRFDNGRGGRLAILAPDVFERLDFSAGGFGVRYGSKLSSALDIKLRSATRDRVQGALFADSGTAGITVETPLGKRGGWLFSARRSYIDVAFKVIDLQNFGRPRNFDFINKVDLDLAPRHKLVLTALNFFERFTLTRDEARRLGRRVDRLETVRSSRRAVLGARLDSALGTGAFSQLTLWASGQHADGTFLRLNGVLQRARDLRDAEIGIKEEASVAFGRRLSFETGGGIFWQQADYYTFERGGFSPLEEEFFAPTHSHRLRLDATASGYAYAQASWRATRSLPVIPGIRFDRYGITRQTLASPRLAARLALTPRLAVRFASGLYRQPPALFILSLAPENRHLRAMRAVHAIVGLEWLVREDVRVVVEAYRKDYADLIVQPTRLLPIFRNAGEGEAEGLDVYVQKTLAGRFAGQIAYSFLRSRRRFDREGPSFPADFERPHQLTIIGITRAFGFGLAAKYRAASGLPYTPTVPVEFRPGFFLQRIARPEDRNSRRLPASFSFDLRVERQFSVRRASFAPYVDMFNVTGRNNSTELNYEFSSPFPTRLREGRFLPIFGARLEF